MTSNVACIRVEHHYMASNCKRYSDIEQGCTLTFYDQTPVDL
jgi:hypothetical protein